MKYDGGISPRPCRELLQSRPRALIQSVDAHLSFGMKLITNVSGTGRAGSWASTTSYMYTIFCINPTAFLSPELWLLCPCCVKSSLWVCLSSSGFSGFILHLKNLPGYEVAMWNFSKLWNSMRKRFSWDRLLIKCLLIPEWMKCYIELYKLAWNKNQFGFTLTQILTLDCNIKCVKVKKKSSYCCFKRKKKKRNSPDFPLGVQWFKSGFLFTPQR